MNQKHSLKKLSLSKKTIAILNNQEMVEMQGGTYTMLAGTCTCACGNASVGCGQTGDCGGGGDCYNAYNTGLCSTGTQGGFSTQSGVKNLTFGNCPTVFSNTCLGSNPSGCTL